MKIIDVNMSVGGRDSRGALVTPEALLEQMSLYRIDRAVCYHENALLDPLSGNAEMKRIASSSAGRIGVSAVLDPVLGADCLPGTGSLIQRLESFQPESLHIFPSECRVPLCPFYWEEILNAADRTGLPILIDDRYSLNFFARLPDIAAQYPNAKFVLARYGTCGSRTVLPLMQKCTNVYFTAESMLDNDQIEEIAEKTGGDKLLFATNWPRLSPAGALGLALYANISEEVRQKLLYRNWEAMGV